MIKIELPFEVERAILACGADMKGAFAIAERNEAYLEDGLGDLSDPNNLARYEKSVAVLKRKLAIKPGIVACDLHPGYFSTRFAASSQLKTRNSRLYKVQHHEAHVASAMADNRIKGRVIGVAFDGTGFGSDGNIWGGEFFVGSIGGFKRAGHLEYVPIPGGEAAIREPGRMATSYLYRAFGAGFIDKTGKRDRAALIRNMIDRGINSPLTSSAGRLFDGAGSLILGRETAKFEAELPSEMEKMAPDGYEERYEFDISDEPCASVVRVNKIFRGIAGDLSRGFDRRLLSGKFHNTVAAIIVKVAARLGKKYGLDRVVLSGGVFQNRYLTAKAKAGLEKSGFGVYLSPGARTTDAGIPLGQIAIANARLACA